MLTYAYNMNINNKDVYYMMGPGYEGMLRNTINL
jgi:hypothetical protein